MTQQESTATAAATRSASQSHPKVYAVVLNWNNYDDSFACITALKADTYPNLAIILVDNFSKDGSGEKLAAAFPEVQFCKTHENLGFSRGCNVGIRAAMEHADCRYILLINNDCVLGANSIAEGVAGGEKDDKIGLVTGKLTDSRGMIWHAGGHISLLQGQGCTRGFQEKDHGQYEEECDTGWASGAMMLIKRKVVERVGPLPEEYFFGQEEWDYSLTALRAGFRIRYVPKFAAVHSGDGSHENYDPKFAYNYYRNKLLFQEKHLGKFLFRLWLIPFWLYMKLKMRKHLGNLEKIHYPGSDRADDVAFAAWEALRDHGKNELNEATMLQFQEVINKRHASQ